MFNFKKIASVLASAIMLSSTIGFAAAAAYPEPFVSGGTADAAIVWGANAAITDLTAAIDLQQNLGALVTTSTTTTATGVVGEAVSLFTGGTKINVNDTLNVVKNVLTKSDLPTSLASGSFSGNVDVSITHVIDLGSNPRILFKRQPTSSDDPNYALTTSTTQANYIYNATATFSKAVNFSHPDSEGETINLFGIDYTISSATDTDTIVLLRSAEKFSLDSDNPTKDVVIEGSSYTVELISASDSAATIKVTDSAGVSNSKEISEAASKKVGAITIGVITADETNLKLSATVVAGTDKVTLEDGASVKTGESDTSIDGTLIDFESGNPNNLTALTISVYASESDKDSIKAGSPFIDPVYKSFKIDFSGFNIETSSTTAREDIKVTPNGDDKMDVSFTDHRGYTKTFQWGKDIVGNVRPGVTGGAQLMVDSDNRNITVMEMDNITSQGYVVVGNEGEGHLLKLTGVKNSSNTGTSNTDGDRVEFTDVFSSDLYKTTWTSDGLGSLIVGGKTYSVYLDGDANNATEQYQVHLDYPDSSGNGVLIAYPTIKTGKGAKIAFYEPLEIPLGSWGIRAGNTIEYNVTEIKIPDGDGYESVTITRNFIDGSNTSEWNFTRDGSTTTMNITSASDEILNSTRWSVEGLTFNFTSQNFTADGGQQNKTVLYLVDPDGGGNINQSALIVWEEKDDNSRYHASIILLETGRSGDDGLGVDTSLSGQTWHNNSAAWQTSRASDSKKIDAADLWGTIITYDTSDSDQPKATISYPDEQLYAQIYMAANSAVITPGKTGAGGGQVLIVKDSEVTSVASKNLVVVGGSCINTVAAKILGSDSPLCTSDFTEKTGAGAGQYVIQTVKSPYSDDKVATLVAGYEAADTENAVKKLLEGGVMTDSGTSQVYPITGTA